MKVIKAIEILEYHKLSLPYDASLDIQQALRLGIWALERHRNRDYLTFNEICQNLPDETPAEEAD